MVVAKKKQSPLRAALDNERGTNYPLLKQRRQEKSAAKRKGIPLHNSRSQPKRKKTAHDDDEDAIIESEEGDHAEANEELDSGSVSDDEGEDTSLGTSLADQIKKLAAAARSVDPERNTNSGKGAQDQSTDRATGDEWESDSTDEEDDVDDEREDERVNGVDLQGSLKANGLAPSSDADSGEEDDEEDDIPLSDLEELDEDEDADIIPHQRLTINNTAALQSSLARIALPTSAPFSMHMSVIGQAPTTIPDVEDDLSRERTLYAQSLDAAQRARPLLAAEGLPFTRPNDYFAEMVKTDAHMGKIRARLVDEAARKKASQEARRMREAKKFGKAVQQEKLKERAAAKRTMLDNVASLKRKRQGEGAPGTDEGLFDIALEDAAETERREKTDRRKASTRKGKDGEPNHKRQKKDEKFGFGGKKRYNKSNDATSTGDMRGYSAGKKAGKTGGRTGKKGVPAKRPGKSRRARSGA